ncbi:FtsW/RodA/SpoVE family cell cycle protein [Lysinibacillus sp. KU-BSD001]
MDSEKFKQFDWKLTFILMVFLCISILAISSAQTSSYVSSNFALKQVIYYGMGACIIGFIMLFDMEQYKKIVWYLYGFGVLLLVVLIFMPEGKGQIGEIVNGAKSWYHTPIGNMQPSEFMKTFYILACAKLISAHNENETIKTLKTDFILLAKILAALIVPLVLIFNQPDLGSSLVFLAITLVLIIVAGISWSIIVPTLAIGSGIAVLLLWMAVYMPNFLEENLGFRGYHSERIYSWLDPHSYAANEGFQLISSLNAIGSGEIIGKGYQDREVYVVENHTDFIFTVIGEEWGFLGASLVICLYFFLIYHLIQTAFIVRDSFSTYICAGIIAMITFHVLENIGMTIQLLPITGIPLPFISYGGSSLMGNALALGLIFSMRFYHKQYMFTTDEEH